ncbi:conserved hypothetical protein (plasmid) [Allorhizobium ampelinum S4]|uniref:HTH cro/C1-type domain-containing protein n=1 Tax=Allorhizobium ampelinum (strain ATCC BAA-846 / DSM 112012 / S4) TaxID=311402 RepID=B9K3A2_ALLAM|nr:helix-turn-helix transcriptional regulator [Allorhizobium ampelinum]ACM39350.1 conserved hypothetical protein [Allorhizobium ampelinum S4]
MDKEIDSLKTGRGLVRSLDPEIEKPHYRMAISANGGQVPSMGEMERKLSAFLRKMREQAGLTRAEFAPLLGLSVPVYSRYERAFSKIHVTRLLHVCELLGLSPVEMLYEAAPHLWGSTDEEAEDRFRLVALVLKLPHRTTRDLMRMVEHLGQMENGRVATKPY